MAPLSGMGVRRAAWGAGGGETVSLNTANISNNSGDIGTAYANLQYNTDGAEYTNSVAWLDNFSTSRGNWLDSGSNSNVWFERQVTAGSALWVDPGAGRLQMSSTRSMKQRDTNAGAGGVSTTLTITMWDASTGGSKLDEVVGLVLTATYFDACPACCFTPDTPVTMADGTHKPIGEIVIGDEIRTLDGTEAVEEIMVREDREMWRMELEDGRTLHLSSDHPVYVDGKGYSSIDPEHEYKGESTTGVLEEGDLVKLESGVLLRINSLRPDRYTLKVYTLGNKRFYANGILVF